MWLYCELQASRFVAANIGMKTSVVDSNLYDYYSREILNRGKKEVLDEIERNYLTYNIDSKTFEKTFTVNKKAITVALNAGQTKVYGADLGALTVNITGAAAADEAALKADVKFAGVDKKTKVGSHNITLDKTTESVWKNYNPTFTPGQINVTNSLDRKSVV